MRAFFCLATLLLLLTACASALPAGGAPVLAAASPTPTTVAATPTPTTGPCQPEPVTAPTLPASIPGYTLLDETTGLHVTGQHVEVDLADYRLRVTGKVDHPLELTYDELRCMPKVTQKPVLICPGVFEDVATWSGVPLSYIFELAGVQEEAEAIQLVSADGYQAHVLMVEALYEDNFLAYEWEGQPLPILHGFPVRAVMPALMGSKWAKWLVEIQVE
jgi:DMSO/TMAO reductase YedYZ molybdopterin-dependent catalytic subunit